MNASVQLWEVDIYPAVGQPDLVGRRVAADAADMDLAAGLRVAAAYGYLIQGSMQAAQVQRLARELLSRLHIPVETRDDATTI